MKEQKMSGESPQKEDKGFTYRNIVRGPLGIDMTHADPKLRYRWGQIKPDGSGDFHERLNQGYDVVSAESLKLQPDSEGRVSRNKRDGLWILICKPKDLTDNETNQVCLDTEEFIRQNMTTEDNYSPKY